MSDIAIRVENLSKQYHRNASWGERVSHEPFTSTRFHFDWAQYKRQAQPDGSGQATKLRTSYTNLEVETAFTNFFFFVLIRETCPEPGRRVRGR